MNQEAVALLTSRIQVSRSLNSPKDIQLYMIIHTTTNNLHQFVLRHSDASHNRELSCRAVRIYPNSDTEPTPLVLAGPQAVSSNDLLCSIPLLLPVCILSIVQVEQVDNPLLGIDCIE
jgi:hypothetical protein